MSVNPANGEAIAQDLMGSCAAASRPTGLVSFYHLTTTTLDQALPKLLEKAYGSGLRAHVWCESEARMEQLSALLWTYDPASFLPHGSEKELHPEQQPILIATSLPPRLRGGGGGDTPNHGKIGEGTFTSRMSEALEHAKELRANLTEPEKKLWYLLQKNNLGFSFRKQHPIGSYIADFACIEKQLIIELDGGQHASEIAKDEARTRFLKEAGFNVIRFWNHDVTENIEGVVEAILLALVGHPPLTPPASGGRTSDLPPRPRSGGTGDFDCLFITHGQTVVNPTSFDRVFDLFDGKDSAATDAARARWKHYKDQGLTLSYFKQTPAGGWEKAA